MIRCIRIWTGEDENSHFEEGWIELEPGAHGDLLSGKLDDRRMHRSRKPRPAARSPGTPRRSASSSSR